MNIIIFKNLRNDPYTGYLHLSWEDNFEGSSYSVITGRINGSITLTNNSWIHFCLFIDVQQSIYYYNTVATVNILIEDCVFNNCSSLLNGGAIYLSIVKQSIIDRVCGMKCFTKDISKQGQFGYISEKNDIGKNNCLMSSIAESGYSCDNVQAFRLSGGQMKCNNLNSSFNRCDIASGIYLSSPNSSYISLSTFSNNTEYSGACIFLILKSHFLSRCNVIRNSEMTSLNGLIFQTLAGDSVMEYSIIDKNDMSPNSFIVKCNSNILTLSFCYLQSNKTYGQVNIQSPNYENNQWSIIHYQTAECNQEIPYKNTPLPTIEGLFYTIGSLPNQTHLIKVCLLCQIINIVSFQ